MWLTIQLWHSCYGNLIDIEDLAAHVIECEWESGGGGLSESHYCRSCLAGSLSFIAYGLFYTCTFCEHVLTGQLRENHLPPTETFISVKSLSIPTFQKQL